MRLINELMSTKPKAIDLPHLTLVAIIARKKNITKLATKYKKKSSNKLKAEELVKISVYSTTDRCQWCKPMRKCLYQHVRDESLAWILILSLSEPFCINFRQKPSQTHAELFSVVIRGRHLCHSVVQNSDWVTVWSLPFSKLSLIVPNHFIHFLMMAHHSCLFSFRRRGSFHSDFFALLFYVLCVALAWIPWGFEYILGRERKRNITTQMTQRYSVRFACIITSIFHIYTLKVDKSKTKIRFFFSFFWRIN